MEFKDKFTAFVDVLGFKSMIEAAERGKGRSLPEIKEILSDLERIEDKSFYASYGPQICPESCYVQEDLDFQVTQVSDCAIVSAEVSPAGAINIVNHCWSSAITLLTKGVMVRGYITRGSIYHDGTDIFGTGYQSAYTKEAGVAAFKKDADEKGTPFVEVDPSVCSYIQNHTDNCVREMFSRFVKEDGSLTALFPFKRLAHSFAIGGMGMPSFDPEYEKAQNNIVRTNIVKLKEQLMLHVDPENSAAMKKTRHYISALDDQLEVCAKTDEVIETLSRPISL